MFQKRCVYLKPRFYSDHGISQKKNQIKVEIYVSDSAQFIKMNQRKKSQGSHRSHQGQLCQVTAAVLIQLVQYKRPSEV